MENLHWGSTPAGLKKELQSLWCRGMVKTCLRTRMVDKEEEDCDDGKDGKLNYDGNRGGSRSYSHLWCQARMGFYLL